MADDVIRKKFPNNFGLAWVDLLESDVSEHAKICYVAMTSFGPVSRAGKASIARRMGVKSISTVKAAQAELVKAGWIVKVVEGGGTTPSVWDVFEKPTGALSAPPQGAECPTPGRNAPPKQEDKQETKQRNTTAADAPFLAAFRQRWTKKTGASSWLPEQGYKQALASLRSNGVDLAEFQAAADAYFQLDDPYLEQAGWPLKGLTSWRWNQLKLKRDKGDDPRPGPTPPKLVL